LIHPPSFGLQPTLSFTARPAIMSHHIEGGSLAGNDVPALAALRDLVWPPDGPAGRKLGDGIPLRLKAETAFALQMPLQGQSKRQPL
jgi:hypothetical protein